MALDSIPLIDSRFTWSPCLGRCLSDTASVASHGAARDTVCPASPPTELRETPSDQRRLPRSCAVVVTGEQSVPPAVD